MILGSIGPLEVEVPHVTNSSLKLVTIIDVA